MRLLEIRDTVLGIERVHLERLRMHEQTRSYEALLQLMVAYDMTNILAKEAFDTLTKFLHSIDVHLIHPPGPVRRVRRARLELLDLHLGAKVRRDIGDKVSYKWKRA